MLSVYIQQLRKKHDMTQDFLASKLGISRPTYAKIENGEQDLTLPQARELAGLFNLSFQDFISGVDEGPVVQVQRATLEKKQDMRIILPAAKLDKFKEVLLYMLTKIGSKPNIGESLINKLLYFIDFDYYEKYEEQLIGAVYIKNHYGPTPCELIKVVKDMKENSEIEEVKSKYFTYDQKKYLPLRKPDLSLLSAREIEHIDDVLNRLSDKSATEMSRYSHEDIPWKVHADGQKISYETVFYRDEKYSVRSYDDAL